MSEQNSPADTGKIEPSPQPKSLSRRTILKIGGTLATAAVAAPILAACGDSPTATTSAVSTTAAASATTAPASATTAAASATTAAASATTAAAASATTAAASATTAAAAGATTSAVATSGTLTAYWGPGHNYKAYHAVIDKFQQDYPGWKIDWQLYQAADLHTKLLANYAAGNVPDIIESSGWLLEFGIPGKIQSLQPYIERDGKAMGFPSDWQPYTVASNTINGEVMGVKLHLTCVLPFYNKDMFSKAGITKYPTTWDEFLETAKALTSGSQYGFALNSDASYGWPWFIQNGVTWLSPDKKTMGFDTPEAIEAMQFQADLIYKHKVAPVPVSAVAYEGPQKLFSAKRAAMILTGPWDILSIQQGSPDVNFVIGQALTHKVQATSAGGTDLFIPKGAKNPDMAWEFIKRITALDVEVAATKEANMTMPRISWGKDPQVEANPIIKGFAEGLSYTVDYTLELGRTGKQPAIMPLYNNMYADVIYKNTPASDALKAFTAAANKILAG
jgi:multiple sugar transport system substrate-binding protein